MVLDETQRPIEPGPQRPQGQQHPADDYHQGEAATGPCAQDGADGPGQRAAGHERGLEDVVAERADHQLGDRQGQGDQGDEQGQDTALQFQAHLPLQQRHPVAVDE